MLYFSGPLRRLGDAVGEYSIHKRLFQVVQVHEWSNVLSGLYLVSPQNFDLELKFLSLRVVEHTNNVIIDLVSHIVAIAIISAILSSSSSSPSFHSLIFLMVVCWFIL
jgi:hypothetical protein